MQESNLSKNPDILRRFVVIHITGHYEDNLKEYMYLILKISLKSINHKINNHEIVT